MSRSYRKGFQGAGDKGWKKIFNRRIRHSEKCQDIPSGSAYKKYNCSYEIADQRVACSFEEFKSWSWVYDKKLGWDPYGYGDFHDEKTAQGYWKRHFASK